MIINQDIVPSTIEAAVNEIVNSLDQKDIDTIKATPHADISAHFTIGMYIRNSWSLWEKDSPIKRDAIKTYGIAHADDISGLIMAWAVAKVRNEPFDTTKHCDIYRKHWEKLGLDSVEAGE